MAETRIIQRTQPIVGIAPIADAFSGVVRTDVINMRDSNTCNFSIFTGVGVTGTSTIAVFSSDDTSITTSAAVTFRYREYPSTGVPGDLVKASTSGFTSTAGSNRSIDVEVDAAELSGTHQYVFLRATEVTDSPVLGGIQVRLSGNRQQGDDNRTQIT